MTSVALTGSSGLIGSALIPALQQSGLRILRLVRRPPAHPDEVAWDPDCGDWKASALDGTDAVIHLAGENMAAGRWTEDRKRRLVSSRVDATRRLVDALAQLPRPPRAFLCASAVGFYGPSEHPPRTEQSPPGTGFLADLCREWEAAALRLRDRNVRVVCLRIGPVLSGRGGMLARLRPLFRMGLGGPLGNGRQILSWISEPDVVRAILHIVATDAITGPVNLVSPNPISNEAFARTLARTVHRPALFRVPAFALRTAFGDMAEEMLLAGARVLPRVLDESGFTFTHPGMEQALAACR